VVYELSTATATMYSSTDARTEAEGGWHVAEQGRGGWLRMTLWMRLRIRLWRAGVHRRSCGCAGSDDVVWVVATS
jgi:hypothetical protein